MRVIKICKTCTEEFVSYDVGKRKNNVFCSIQCKAESQKGEKVSRLNIECSICKKICIILPYQEKENFYCSKPCQHKSLIFWKTATDEQKLKRLKQSYEKYIIRKDGCWDWSGAKNKKYGVFSHDKRNMQAHRASWIIHNGPIKENMHICHTCDNPTCSNPLHLFMGTHLDNMRDMRDKGLHNQFSKLTIEQVKEIKKLLAQKISQRDIAKKFNVHDVTIHDIKYEKTWKSIKS